MLARLILGGELITAGQALRLGLVETPLPAAGFRLNRSPRFVQRTSPACPSLPAQGFD
jgi:enoyl-CoA hydratase/carnithine racemase